MSLADDVQALELERDALKTNLAAAQAAVKARVERGSVAVEYWRSRAEQAEARVALLEAYSMLREYAQQPPSNPGKWHIEFAVDRDKPAGLDFEGASLAQALSGLLIGWFDSPRELDISITKPEVGAKQS